MSRKNDKRTKAASETRPSPDRKAPDTSRATLQFIRRDYDDAGVLKD